MLLLSQFHQEKTFTLKLEKQQGGACSSSDKTDLLAEVLLDLF